MQSHRQDMIELALQAWRQGRISRRGLLAGLAALGLAPAVLGGRPAEAAALAGAGVRSVQAGAYRYALAWIPYSSLYCPPRASSSPCVPTSATRDPSSTTIRSA